MVNERYMALHMIFFMLTVVSSAFVIASEESKVGIYYVEIGTASADFISAVILAFICS